MYSFTSRLREILSLEMDEMGRVTHVRVVSELSKDMMEESPDRNFDFDPQDTFSPSAAHAHPAYMIAETAICQCPCSGRKEHV